MTASKQPAPGTKRPIDMRYLESTVGYSIRRAQMAVFQHIYQSFDDKALTLVQFSVMAVAADNPGVTQSELAQVLAVERPRIVPILNRLEELGFAKRVVSEDDKRNRQIVLTASGAARLRELKRRFAAHERELDELLGKRKTGLLDALHRLSGIGE